LTDNIADQQNIDAIQKRWWLHLRGRFPEDSKLSVKPIVMVSCKTTRRTTTQREEPKTAHGRPDLSHFARYVNLATHEVPGLRTDRLARTYELIKEGSIKESPCSCQQGRVRCDSCSGKRTMTCAKTIMCKECGGQPVCTLCKGQKTITDQVRRKVADDRGASPEQTWEHTRSCPDCKGTGKKCPSCRASGKAKCPDCDGKGRKQCDGCSGEGTTKHELCQGTGVRTSYTLGLFTSHDTTERGHAATAPLPLRVRRLIEARAARTEVITDNTNRLPDDLPPDLQAKLQPLLGTRRGQIRGSLRLRTWHIAELTSETIPEYRYFAFPRNGNPRPGTLVAQPRYLTFFLSILTALTLLLVAVLFL
jgi:hypothetical protein